MKNNNRIRAIIDTDNLKSLSFGMTGDVIFTEHKPFVHFYPDGENLVHILEEKDIYVDPYSYPI